PERGGGGRQGAGPASANPYGLARRPRTPGGRSRRAWQAQRPQLSGVFPPIRRHDILPAVGERRMDTIPAGLGGQDLPETEPRVAGTGRRPRWAVVSTFDQLCGIAAYTQALVRQFGESVDIKVFALDQYLLRSLNPRVREQGDASIRRMCAEFKGYDFVNIQLEHGTLGRRPVDILRRFQLIVAAAPALSVTFHTVLQADD